MAILLNITNTKLRVKKNTINWKLFYIFSLKNAIPTKTSRSNKRILQTSTIHICNGDKTCRQIIPTDVVIVEVDNIVTLCRQSIESTIFDDEWRRIGFRSEVDAWTTPTFWTGLYFVCHGSLPSYTVPAA
jgi:hypothetical protein